MSELMGLGIVLIAFTAISFLGLWMQEKSKRKDAEAKVRAHEALQRIESDIANGSDVYVTEQLRKYTRDL